MPFGFFPKKLIIIEHVTFGLDGGVTYDWNLPNVERPPPMSPYLLGKKVSEATHSPVWSSAPFPDLWSLFRCSEWSSPTTCRTRSSRTFTSRGLERSNLSEFDRIFDFYHMLLRCFFATCLKFTRITAAGYWIFHASTNSNYRSFFSLLIWYQPQ